MRQFFFDFLCGDWSSQYGRSADDLKEAWCGFDVSLICGLLIAAVFFVCIGIVSSSNSETLYQGCGDYKCRYCIF